MFVFDITKEDTFIGITSWLEEVYNHSISNPSLFLLGNKVDIAENRKVDIGKAEDFAKKNGMSYFEVSAKTDVNINTTFEHIVGVIYKKIEDGILNYHDPSSGVKRGRELKQVEKNSKKLSKEKFNKHNKRCGIC